MYAIATGLNMAAKKTLNYYRERISGLLADEKYSKAFKTSREGLLFYPDSPEIALMSAISQVKMGDFSTAKTKLEKLLSRMSKNSALLINLFEVYLNLGKRDKADFYAKKVSHLYRTSGEVFERIALVYAQHNFCKDAITYFSKAAKLVPSNAYLYLGLGVCYDLLGEMEKSVKNLKKAIKLKRNFYTAIGYLANVYYDCDKKSQAIDYFKQIPVDEFTDPIGIGRLIEHYGGKRDKKYTDKLKNRLKVLFGKQKIFGFINKLEQNLARSYFQSSRLKNLFFKLPSKNKLTISQKTNLYDMDRYLVEIFGKPLHYDFINLPELKHIRKSYLEKIIAVFKSYADSFVKKGKLSVGLWGFDIISFYMMSVFKFIYDENLKLKLQQKTIDDIFNSIIKIIKNLPVSNRNRAPLIELGAFIIAFWKQEDMLNRAILIKEILTEKEKKIIELMVRRGRAWRKWLGFKAESKWSSPWVEIFEKMPKTYGQNKTVRCAACKSVIKDFWNIATTYNGKPIRCGDCSILVRCSKCKSPARHILTEKKPNNVEKRTYKCMQCGKCEYITVKIKK